MLQSRTFISIIRQRPFQPSKPRIPSTLIARVPPLLRQSRVQRRPHSVTSLISKRTLSRPAWRISSPLRFRALRRSSDKHSPRVTPELGSPAPQGLSARFKQLSRKYGWSAVGVYFGLSVLDFPFCFLAVRLVGPERVGEVEHAIVDGFWSLVGLVMPSMKPEDRISIEEAVEAAAREATPVNGNGHKHKEEASIWTQLLLAYGVHKSLIFFRIPLTAAVTPKVVKTLQGWGWNVGYKKARVRAVKQR